MGQSKHFGITESIMRKSPLSPRLTSFCLFIFLITGYGILAFSVGEFERFQSDYSVMTILLGFSMLLWGEMWTAQKMREGSKYLKKVFQDVDTEDYLRAIFDNRIRFSSGIIIGGFMLIIYGSLGFWYSSPILLWCGTVLVGFIAFTIGSLLPALWFLFFKTQQVALYLFDKLDVLNHEHIKAIEMLTKPCVHSAAIVGCVGAVTSFGILLAPWQLNLTILSWIPLVFSISILIVLLLIFIIPMSAIHNTLRGARERKQIDISKKIVGMYSAINTSPDDLDEKTFHKLESLSIFSQYIEKVSVWPLGVRQFVGMVGPLIAVIIETYVIHLIYG